MLPFIRFEGLSRHHLEGVFLPTIYDVCSYLPAFHPEVESAETRLVIHLRKDGTGRFPIRLNPTRDTEGQIEFYVHRSIEFELRASIQFESLRRLAIRDFKFSFLDNRGRACEFIAEVFCRSIDRKPMNQSLRLLRALALTRFL